jgi:predicted small secreted protein
MTKNVAMVFLTLFLLAGAATALSGCNTVAGFGEDMSAAGRALTGAADTSKKP